jgi:diacylglycerol kinase
MKIMKDIKKIYRSIRYALKGLVHAYRSDQSFRMEINYGLPIYLFLGWYFSPLTPWEFLLLVLSYLLILVVELVNTAFEKMLDRVHPEEHELIGKSKDIAAAGVLLTFLFALTVVGVLFWIRCESALDVSVSRIFV